MTFFPPDVSLRVDPSADVDAAQQMFPAARQLLFRALNMQQAGVPLVQLFLPGNDGSLISVYLADGVKHVYVQPARPVSVTKKVEEEEFDGEESVVYLMLSGVVRPGTLVDGKAHEFHPTQVCANVYELDYAYQDMAKLGVPDEGTIAHSHLPKPSEYSGAMKRVVQALYGIGRTGSTTYSTDLAGAGATVTLNQYRREWLCTHGIHRDAQGVWLIEISRDRGVLKMKLPLFDGTDSDSYLDFLVEIGDSDTVSIVTEFGGLPNGETFPENDENAVPPVMALDEAIASGDVVRLAKPEDIAEFYVDSATKINKLALWGNCCWAFSETGAAVDVHNTCFWYSDQAFATIWDYNRSPHGELLVADPAHPLATVATLSERCMRTEHWKIMLFPSTATLSVIEKSLFSGPQKKALDFNEGAGPQYYVDELFREASGYQLLIWCRPPDVWFAEDASQIANNSYNDLDCPVLVFYNGESLEVVRHKRPKQYGNGFITVTLLTPSDANTFIGGSVLAVDGALISFSGNGTPLLDPNTGEQIGEYGIGVWWEDYSRSWAYWNWRSYIEISAHAVQYTSGPNAGLVVGITSAGLPPPSPGYLHDMYMYQPPPHYDFTADGIRYEIQVSGPIYGTSYGTTYWPLATPDDPLGYSRTMSQTWQRSGSFYSTSLDLREDRRYGNTTWYTDGRNNNIVDHAENWEQEIGAVIPALTREAILFVKWDGGMNVTRLFPDPVYYSLPTVVTQHFLCPGLGGVVDGPTLDPITVWEWEKITNASGFSYAASVNAGPTKCGIVQDGIYAEIVQNYPNVEILTPPATFLGTANGIPVDDCIAKDTTFVGAV